MITHTSSSAAANDTQYYSYSSNVHRVVQIFGHWKCECVILCYSWRVLFCELKWLCWSLRRRAKGGDEAETRAAQNAKQRRMQSRPECRAQGRDERKAKRRSRRQKKRRRDERQRWCRGKNRQSSVQWKRKYVSRNSLGSGKRAPI